MSESRSRTARAAAQAALVCAVALSACANPGDQQSSRSSPDFAQQPAPAVDLVGVTVDEWTQAMAELEGSIVVADMWATWCIPCIERFPHMIELFHRYQEAGVTFVSVCLDDPGDLEAVAAARRFLEQQGATFTNFLITENTADAFEKLDLMTIPAVFVYGANGRQRFRLTADDPNNQFTDADVEAAIVALLSEGGPTSLERVAPAPSDADPLG